MTEETRKLLEEHRRLTRLRAVAFDQVTALTKKIDVLQKRMVELEASR